jgi:NADH-quinone oxidoreductase subunit J
VIPLFAANATVPDIIIFVVGAILALAGAAGVVVSKNPVHAALSLVTTLFGVAVLFIEQEAHFLAAVQVIVYAGAIVVLFLFVIMLLGVDRPESAGKPDIFKAWRPFVVVLSAAVGVLVLVLANWDWKATGQKSVGGPASGPGSNVEKLADSIFQQYLLPFEATSLLLVIAVVAAVILARRPNFEDELLEESEGELAIEVGSTGDAEVTQ